MSSANHAPVALGSLARHNNFRDSVPDQPVPLRDARARARFGASRICRSDATFAFVPDDRLHLKASSGT